LENDLGAGDECDCHVDKSALLLLLFWFLGWLTRLVFLQVTENSKIKCYKYWPGTVKSKTFGQFVVTLVAKEKEHGLVTRTVKLERRLPDREPESRQIYHFQ
jgi:hypothetical protein